MGRPNGYGLWIAGSLTEEVLVEMREAEIPVRYLVPAPEARPGGTPRGHLTRDEVELSALPWERVRPNVRVKVLPADGEVYVPAESGEWRLKERGIRLRSRSLCCTGWKSCATRRPTTGMGC
ncbi:MAG: hypothetical protein ABSG98_05970 [Anaerolineales bacterium]